MSEQGDNIDGDETPEEEYPLATPEPESAPEPEVKDAIWFPGRSGEPHEPEPPERFQFTLAELLMLTAVVALILGTVGLFPGGFAIENFAGVAGIGLLLGIFVLMLMQDVRPIIHVAWWVMLGLYVLACVVAFVGR